MTPEQEDAERQAVALETASAAAASAGLASELAAAAAVLLGLVLRHLAPAVLRTSIRRLIGALTPSARTVLETTRIKGLNLGNQLGLKSPEVPAGTEPELEPSGQGSTGMIRAHNDLQTVIEAADPGAKARLDEAVKLAGQLPMTDDADVMAVIGKAHSAVQRLKTDAAWVAIRSIALGVVQVARAAGLNVVWIAERDACLHCLAYAGRVISPGGAFPAGLTYADKPLKPYGWLIGPPLHPHCRCHLQITTYDPGSVDLGLAREAARSVARGLSDFASEPALKRAADRLVHGAGHARLLPKSVLARAKRNVAAGKLRFRPDSPEARAEIARRNTAVRARLVNTTAKVTKPTVPKPVPVPVPAPSVPVPSELTGRSAAEGLAQPLLQQGPERSALLDYTGGSYGELNYAKRHGKPLTDRQNEIVAGLTTLAEQHPLPFPVVMYRGREDAKRPRVGSVVEDKAPMSGTLSERSVANFGVNHWIIHVPAGTPAIPVSQLQRGPKYRFEDPGVEDELILLPGTRLRILSVKGTTVEAEVVHN